MLLQLLRRLVQCVAGEGVKLPQGFLCLSAQVLRRLDDQRHIVVAPHLGIAHRGNALAPQADLCVCLCARLYIVHHIAVHGLDADVSAQSCLGKGDGHCGEDIHILPHKDGVTRHCHLHKQISSRAAVYARLSLLADADALSVVNTRRDGHSDLLLAGNIAGSAAVRALVLDDLSAAVAVRTCLYVLHCAEEGLLGVDNLALAAAFWTGLGGCTRLGPCPVALRTGILEDNLNLLLAAKHSLLKCDADALADVHPLHGTLICPSSAPASAEQIAENVSEDVTEISAAEIKSSEASGSAGAALKGSMAELVILTALLRIAQDRVGLRRLFKFLLRLFISGIHIRMVLFCHLPVCLFQSCLVRVPADAQHLVVISL